MITDLALLERLASRYDIPPTDAVLIAMNACGATSELDTDRARMQVKFPDHEEEWQIILPLGADVSPFDLDGDLFMVGKKPVCELAGIENDDVVLTYLRAGGTSLTLNTHSRSICTGCLFCPNVIEDAADATLRNTNELEKLLEWVIADNEWGDLGQVEVITVCTGCFQTAAAAIAHMQSVKAAADSFGFEGRLHLLSSVIRERADLERIAADLSPFHLTLTIECFTRRRFILKESKASLTLDDCCRILDDCADLGILGDFTYVVGLDPLEETIAGLERLCNHATTFPRIQVYQAHNDLMRRARAAEAAVLDYFFEVRQAIGPSYARAGLVPRSWENYRPLWYTDFCGIEVEGPRI